MRATIGISLRITRQLSSAITTPNYARLSTFPSLWELIIYTGLVYVHSYSDSVALLIIMIRICRRLSAQTSCVDTTAGPMAFDVTRGAK